MKKFNETIFEGSVYKKFQKKIFSNKIYYQQLNLNRTWISDLIPNYIKKEKTNLSLIFKILLRTVFKIFFIEYIFVKFHKSESKILILTSPSIRLEHKRLLDNEFRSNKKPSIISWEKKLKLKSLKKICAQIEIYFKIIKKLNTITKNKNQIINIAYNSLISIDLYENFNFNKIEAILSFKDFQRHENAIIQKANLLKIKTFTTQHAVHPDFIGKNERGGNIVFSNCESKNILLWGKFCKKSYKKYKKNKKYIHFKNIFIPQYKYKNFKKNVLLICFGSNRHISENIEIVRLIKKNKEFINNNFNLLIKIHPAINLKKFNNFFKEELAGIKYKILNTKLNSYYILGNDNYAITGLSGSYYDCLYLGFRTIFFDYNYLVSQKLPRIYNNLNKHSNLRKIIGDYKKISNFEWDKRANIVLKNVWGISMKEKSHIGITEKISQYIN